MKYNTIPAEKDPMGAAIQDYFTNKKAGALRVFSSQFEEDEMPVSQLFRAYEAMSELEKTALNLSSGKILDVGAGSGCHSLALQKMGKDVCAIDISELSVNVIKEQGVENVRNINFFDPHFNEKFDTILMLMNGSGIIGKIQNLPDFFARVKDVLTPGGSVFMDSSDLRYLFEEEDGSFLINLAGEYYGEIDYQMQYKNIKGDEFEWLYIDFQTLSMYASECGFTAELIKNGDHYDYLACLKVK